MHTSPVSNVPAESLATTAPTVAPAPVGAPHPAVPYGGAVTAADSATVSPPISAQSVAKGVGQAALKMGVRTIIFFVLRAFVKAIFKR